MLLHHTQEALSFNCLTVLTLFFLALQLFQDAWKQSFCYFDCTCVYHFYNIVFKKSNNVKNVKQNLPAHLDLVSTPLTTLPV